MAKRKHTNFYLPLVALSVLFLVTSYFILFSPIHLFRLLRPQYSLSLGDRYNSRLQLWYYYAKAGDWSHAVALESGLDPIDISAYKSANYPPEIKKRLNSLMVKNPKSPDDLIELAKILASIDKFSDATLSATQANLLDPVRADLEKIYYQILP